MASVQCETSAGDENVEYRVPVSSKKQLTEQINKFKDVLRTALDGQTDVHEDTKRVLLQELLANFEAAVQLNVLVNGQPWEDAPDAEEEDEAIDLESLLDDAIVETTRRRLTYPKQILPHVVHSLKAERKLMGLYEHKVKPQEVVKDPDQESIMRDLSAQAPGLVQSAIQMIKSVGTLQQQAEGLCEILNMKPSHNTVEIQNLVFDAATRGPARSRQPIRRALEEAAATDCYGKKHKPEEEPQH
ncbi:hypothetical protein Q5P01_004620 [Channa striata]|uniref:NSL1 component of MIS12 kinetochore complex n=1 Tax=Channa striata TaxID=64152 RepID=A0AA88NLU6_CHASR|nr:hypothetical protein Q5P01_004620 [Channa striata]